MNWWGRMPAHQDWSVTVLVTAIGLAAGWVWVTANPRVRQRLGGTRPVTLSRHAAFAVMLVLYLMAFGSPMNVWADRFSFAIHMSQHMLEVMGMVPFGLLAMPDWLVRPLLKVPGFQFFTRRFVGLLFFGVVLNGFHWPWLYDWTLRSAWVHGLEHGLFFVGALFFWWPLLSPLPEIPPFSPGWQIVYAMSGMNIMMPISVYLLISRVPWYAYPYAHDPALRVLGLTPLADQQWGGLIMLLAGGTALGASLVRAFWRYQELGPELLASD